MECVKMDDPRLDESFSFLFAFKKGDTVTRKDDPSIRGHIRDGVYIGEFPKAAARLNARGKTLYEVVLADQLSYVVDQVEIQLQA